MYDKGFELYGSQYGYLSILMKTVTRISISVFLFSSLVFAKAMPIQAQKIVSEELLNLSDEKIDLATAILSITNESGLISGSLAIQSYVARINQMGSNVKAQLQPNEDIHNTLEKISHYIRETEKFSFDEADKEIKYPENTLISTFLDRKKGNCLSLAYLYLVLAHKLGIELQPVVTPEHVYLRYQGNGKQIAVEATDGKVNQDEAIYKKVYHIKDDDQFYWRNLFLSWN